MKVAILDTYYPAFLASLYGGQPGLKLENYAVQHQALMDSCFGTSDSYSRHLNELGCEVIDLIGNAIPLQLAWAREHGYPVSGVALRIDPRLSRIRGVGNLLSWIPGLIRVVVEQVRRLKPDVLFCQDTKFLPPTVLRALRRHVRLVVGQIASPAPRHEYLASFDLILTSFPHFVSQFRRMGIDAEYFRIAFDPRVLEKLGHVDRNLDITFVGGISPAHTNATKLLESLALSTPIEFYGYGRSLLSDRSPILPRHRGEVWGLEMYRTLARSRVTLNRHIDVAANYANNMRLYEATGVGTLLVTDRKDTLGDLFEVGREVVAYESAAEATEQIQYFLGHPDEASAIARAGQARTLREHTYRHRMEELLPTLEAALGKKSHAKMA